MRKTALILAASFAMAGCAVTRPLHQISAPFDAAHAQRLVQDGPNTVKGSAFMRQRGGGVVTCAGETVHLIPATAYAEERMRVLYRTALGSGVNFGVNYDFQPEPHEYFTLERVTKCDAQGNFVFERVADGEFFVVTTIRWSVAYGATQGGNLMHRVTVTGGQVVNVIMSA